MYALIVPISFGFCVSTKHRLASAAGEAKKKKSTPEPAGAGASTTTAAGATPSYGTTKAKMTLKDLDMTEDTRPKEAVRVDAFFEPA